MTFDGSSRDRKDDVGWRDGAGDGEWRGRGWRRVGDGVCVLGGGGGGRAMLMERFQRVCS